MIDRTLRGRVVVAGIGETAYCKHGRSPDPEFKLALRAILAAAEDAGIDPRDIDGFASFSNDRNEPARLAAALGTRRLRFSNMQWGGGGGGGAAAVGNAAAAIAAGMADCVVVFRALAQGQFGRFGQGAQASTVSGDTAFQLPYGAMSAGQRFGLKLARFMNEHEIPRSALRAVALTCNAHAQNNPRAVMHGVPLDEAKYESSRWIVEPILRLYDCCLENDGAAALILMPAERALDLPHKPVYLLGAAAGAEYRAGAPANNAPTFATAGFTTVAPDLYRMARVGPSDVDVLQSYENFTGAVVMSMVEHGFFPAEAAGEFCTPENLRAPDGRLPLNTSGGNLAECYMHGFELELEAVRQVRGHSTNQVHQAHVSMVTAGPLVYPASSLIFGSEATL